MTTPQAHRHDHDHHHDHSHGVAPDADKTYLIIALLLLLAIWFIIEAIHLIYPPQVEGLLVTVIAVVGVGMNLLEVWTMSKADRQSLTVEGSFQHILTDSVNCSELN